MFPQCSNLETPMHFFLKCIKHKAHTGTLISEIKKMVTTDPSLAVQIANLEQDSIFLQLIVSGSFLGSEMNRSFFATLFKHVSLFIFRTGRLALAASERESAKGSK